jgi:hypothetical protein
MTENSHRDWNSERVHINRNSWSEQRDEDAASLFLLSLSSCLFHRAVVSCLVTGTSPQEINPEVICLKLRTGFSQDRMVAAVGIISPIDRASLSGLSGNSNMPFAVS